MSETHVRGELVREAIDGALRSWPELAPALADFDVHVDRLAIDSGDLRARGGELYLAFACSSGQRAALRVLEQQYLRDAMRSVARVNGAKEFTDEVRQMLSERLLVGPAPKIASFAGTGPLAAWLRVAAVRTALNLQKTLPSRDQRLAEDMIEAAAPDAANNEPFREAVQVALRSALGVLSPRERNLLRLSYIESRSIDQIAALYGAHRATAARWIAAARERVFDRVSEELRETFDLSASEVQSVLVRVRSQLDVSVMRLLGAARELEPLVEET